MRTYVTESVRSAPLLFGAGRVGSARQSKVFAAPRKSRTSRATETGSNVRYMRSADRPGGARLPLSRVCFQLDRYYRPLNCYVCLHLNSYIYLASYTHINVKPSARQGGLVSPKTPRLRFASTHVERASNNEC
eukprot:3145740-Pyramimonas_sp.AAC.1